MKGDKRDGCSHENRAGFGGQPAGRCEEPPYSLVQNHINSGIRKVEALMEGLSEERLAQIENPQRDVRWAGWGRNGTPKAPA